MLDVRDALARGEIVALLADRSMHGERYVECDFLGAPAAFPRGPFELAAMLDVPVVLFSAVYRGACRYDIRFEPLPVGGADGGRGAVRGRLLPCVRGVARGALPRRAVQLVQLLRLLGAARERVAPLTMRDALRIAVLCVVALAAPCAGALTLDALMRQMAAVGERHGSFVETKEMALLNGPIVRRGTLDYTRPDRLSMRVETPYFERVDVVGDQVTLERRTGVTRVALAAQPQLAAWIDSLRATLAGDGAALERHFEVRVDGTDADWRLSLVPRDAALARDDRARRRGRARRGGHPLRDRRGEGRPHAHRHRAARPVTSARAIRALVLAALVLALGAYAATRVRVIADFSAFLPAGADATQRALIQQLREGAAGRLVLVELSGAPPEALASASQQMRTALARSPAFRYVANGDAAAGLEQLALVEAHRYALSPRIAPATFTVDGLRAALQERLEGLYGSAAPLEKRLLAQDPTGETLAILRTLAPARQPQVLHGVWFDPSGTRALLLAETRASAADLAGQADAVAALNAAHASAGGVGRLAFSSPGTLAVQSRDTIAHEARHAVDRLGGADRRGARLHVPRGAAGRCCARCPPRSGCSPACARCTRASGASTASRSRSARRCSARPSTIRASCSRRWRPARRRATRARASVRCCASRC